MENDEIEAHTALSDRLYSIMDRMDFLLNQKYTTTILVLLVLIGIITLITTISREGIISVPSMLYITLGFAIGYYVA